MFAWSRTTYALWHGIIFNFEWKRDLDYFLAHAPDSKRISSVDAWKLYHGTGKEFIRIYCSDVSYRNQDRRKRIKDWYEQNRVNRC